MSEFGAGRTSPSRAIPSLEGAERGLPWAAAGELQRFPFPSPSPAHPTHTLGNQRPRSPPKDVKGGTDGAAPLPVLWGEKRNEQR